MALPNPDGPQVIGYRTDPCRDCGGTGHHVSFSRHPDGITQIKALDPERACDTCQGTGNWFSPGAYRTWLSEINAARGRDGFAMVAPDVFEHLLLIAESVYPCGVHYPLPDGEEAIISETESTYDVDGNIELSVEERDPKDLASRYAAFYVGLIEEGVFPEHALTLTDSLLREEQASWPPMEAITE